MPSIQIPQELVNQIVASTPALVKQTLARQIAPNALEALEAKFSNLTESLVTEKIAELKEAQSVDAIEDEKLQKNELSSHEIDKAFLSIQETVENKILNVVEQFSNEIANRAVEVNSLSQQEFNNFMSSVAEHMNLSVEEVWKDGIQNLETQSENFQTSIREIAKQLETSKPNFVAEFLQNQYRNSDSFQINIGQAQLDVLYQLGYDEHSEVTTLLTVLSNKENALELLRNRNYPSVDARYTAIDEPQAEVDRLKFDCFLSMALTQNQLQEKFDAAYQAIETDIQTLPSNSIAKRNIEQFITDIRNGIESPEMGKKQNRSRKTPTREVNGGKMTDSLSPEFTNTLAVHKTLRFEKILNALEAIHSLKEQQLVSKESDVEVKGAFFHPRRALRGNKVDNTEAAHHLPGQVYIDGKRLDEHIKNLEDSDLLEATFQGQSGGTSVLDKLINDVDSKWERFGLTKAFEDSVKAILGSQLDKEMALKEAFEQLQQDSIKALEKTSEHLQTGKISTEQPDKLIQVVREYKGHLENLKYEELRKAARL